MRVLETAWFYGNSQRGEQAKAPNETADREGEKDDDPAQGWDPRQVPELVRIGAFRAPAALLGHFEHGPRCGKEQKPCEQVGADLLMFRCAPPVQCKYSDTKDQDHPQSKEVANL